MLPSVVGLKGRQPILGSIGKTNCIDSARLALKLRWNEFYTTVFNEVLLSNHREREICRHRAVEVETLDIGNA